jgi:hypothetical protein
VHNAAVGYWSIATGCRAPSTALSAWIDSVGGGLFEAAVQTVDGDAPVLFVAYDAAAAGPLRSVVPFDCGFALALVLAPAEYGSGTQLRLRRAGSADTSTPAADWMQALAARNAAAAGLPLLQALAGAGPRHLRLNAGAGFALQLQVTP